MSIEQAKEVLKIEAEGILALLDQIGPDFDKAINLIMACPSRVILAGIGKSGLIGQKIAATLNSTGTASFFLHPVEAMHGDLGIVDPRDVILAISYSGETAELNLLLNSLKNRNVSIIAMTGGSESTMANLADAVLNVAVPKEACPLGLAPTASTTAALAMGDALAVVLLKRKKFKESDFRKNHPGGSLGERLKVSVSEVMITGEHIPMTQKDTSLRQAVSILNAKNIGAVLIIDEQQRVAGIITDGDIKRILMGQPDVKDVREIKVGSVMTRNPRTIDREALVARAIQKMEADPGRLITCLMIVDGKGYPIGIIHMHDCLRTGIA